MDDNKVKKLIEVGYQIQPCCGNCTFSTFSSNSDFGTCSIHTYEHLKHSDTTRQLSVYRYGSCPEGMLDYDVLGPWDVFFV